MTITVAGVADGGHSLYVYGGDIAECSPELARAKNPLISAPGGEALSAGTFTHAFVVVPDRSSYYVCAYLYADPARFPDAWQATCVLMPLNECYFPVITPVDVIFGEEAAKRVNENAAGRTAEEFAHKVFEEEALARHERAIAEQDAAEEAAARRAKAEAEQKARDAARCHVPAVLGHTLRRAKELLARAHCRLGRVTVRKQAGAERHVVWQRPGKGGFYAPGMHVAVQLG